MVKRYKGGLMSSTEAITSTNDARGMWSSVQATQARNTGNWPALLSTENPGLGTDASFGTGFMTISNVSVTDSNYTVLNDTPNISTSGGYIKLTGRGFVSGCVVYIGGTPATTTIFVSSTEVRAVVPATSSNTLMVYVVNPNGSTGIKLNALTFSGTPSWSTSPTIGAQLVDVAFSVQFLATSDSAITYVLDTGSSLPPGTTLYANGLFTGTVTGVTSDTTYSFSVVANDIENQDASRTFSVTVGSGDQYFNVTPLILAGDSSVWTSDASTNKFTHTITGDTRSTAFSPYNSSWSAYFDGTGDYLTYPANADFAFSTGDFTVECWMYLTANQAVNAAIIANFNNPNGWFLSFATSPANNTVVWSNYNTIFLTSSSAVPLNTWTHIAVARAGTALAMYFNGVSVASATNSTDIGVAAGTNYIGFNNGVAYVTGYISNARVVKGLAVYTGAFTPSTTVLGNTQVSGTNISAITAGSALLTLQDNRFKDNGRNALTFTRAGDVAIKSFGPFADTDTISGSGYFDGAGDYIAATIGALGSGNFTIEFWSYQPSTPAGGRMYYFMTGSSPEWGDANGVQLLEYDGYLALNVGGTSSITIALVPPRSQWNHIAIVRNSGITTTYINGVAAGTTLTNSANLTGTLYRIGLGPTNSGSWSAYYGYMTDFRILNGTALYTATFTPPTELLTAITNTQLLTLQYRKGENNHRVVDEGGNKFLLTRAGQVSQGSFSPFSPSGWSAYFDGSGDYLTVTSSSNLTFGASNDWTIECFVWFRSLASNPMIYDSRPAGVIPGAYPIIFLQSSDSKLQFYTLQATKIASNSALVTERWYHVVVSRVSGTTRMFIDGTVQTQTFTDSTNYILGTNRPAIGIDGNDTASSPFNGYISNLRVLNGTGYTSVSVPTSPLTAIANTQLLTLQDYRFKDNSTNAYAMTRFNDVSIKNFSPFRSTALYSPALHGGSAYFDGTGDYLTAAATSLTLLPTSTTSTFTIDGWLYPTTAGAQKWIIGDMAATGGTNNVAVDISSGGLLELYWYTGGANRATSTGVIGVNQWNYFAIVVNANAIAIYVNSTTPGQTGTTTLTTRSLGTTGWAVGSFNSTEQFAGYMSGIRWANGIARTISAIPTAPPTPDNYTRLLFNFTNGGIVDATARNVIETVADSKIASLQTKFGTGAMYFDGTGDYLTMRTNPAHGFGTGDFTIECWMYCTDASTYRGLMAQGDGSSAGWFLYFNPNPTPLLIFGYGGAITYGAGVVVIGSWCHVAVTRSGSGSNNLKFFVNGSLVTQVTLTNNLSSTSPTYIGASGGGGYPFAGYIDDVRITAGYARYTAAFTAPTSAHLLK